MVLAIPLLAGDVAFAQESATTPQPATSSPSNSGENGSQAREKRVEERKEKSQRSLTQLEQNIVKSKCQTIHASVKTTQSRLSSFEPKRTQVYGRFVERLQGFSAKLKAAGIDVTTYDRQVMVLKTKAHAFNAEIAALQQAVDDLSTMDCTVDPEGFAVTLLEAKALRSSVINKGKDFRTYLRDTFKPVFTNIRTELQLQTNNTKEEG